MEICSALKDKGCKFSLSLRLGSSFNLSLSSEGSSPEATKRTRRSPSYLRRQTRRRAAFLARKEKHPLAEVVTPNNQASRQGGATLLEKKTASSWQTVTSEGETAVDNNCSLDLNPNPTLPRGPDESMESHDSIENVCKKVSNQVSIKEKGNGGSEAFTPHSVIFHPHLDYDSEFLKWEAEKIQQGFLLPNRGYAKHRYLRYLRGDKL